MDGALLFERFVRPNSSTNPMFGNLILNVRLPDLLRSWALEDFWNNPGEGSQEISREVLSIDSDLS